MRPIAIAALVVLAVGCGYGQLAAAQALQGMTHLSLSHSLGH